MVDFSEAVVVEMDKIRVHVVEQDKFLESLAKDVKNVNKSSHKSLEWAQLVQEEVWHQAGPPLAPLNTCLSHEPWPLHPP